MISGGANHGFSNSIWIAVGFVKAEDASGDVKLLV